jgi:tetratricopeptide (TPR) repeat protein
LLGRLTHDYRWNGERVRRAVRQTVARVEPTAAKRLLDAVRVVIEPEPEGLGWLGDSYRSAGFEAEAMACYEKAVTVPSATADDWLRLAMRKATAGETEPGRVLTRAKEKLNTPQLYLMTAALFADTPLAPKGWSPELGAATDRKLYTQARLAVKLSRFQKNEAIGLLEDYLTDSKLPPTDAAWARRNLAMMLASRGTGTDRTRARELLVRDDGSAGQTVDDKRSTAAVLTGLSKQLEGADRDSAIDRAIQVMKEVAAESKNPRDKFLLSQLYRTSAGYKSDARATEFRAEGRVILQDLIRVDPKNPEYYVAALDEATEPQDQEIARKCADHLIASYKNDFRVVQAVARYECRAGKPENALAHIVAYARTANATPGDLQARAARSAELLDELARKPTVRGTEVGRKMTDVAVEKYESLFATTPDAIVAIAGLLSNDGRAAEAFAKIEKHAKFLPSRVKVLAGLAVLRVGGAPAVQFERVKEWLAASLNEEPGSVAVRMNEGEFCTLRGDVTGAETAYKTVLETDDQHVPALNNLAWILSANPDAADRALELVDRAVRVIGLTGELLDTRARVKIAKRQFDAAERDLQWALHQEQTPVRLFHMALVKSGQDKVDDARDSFSKAKQRGLREVTVHPVDVALYRQFDKSGAN